MARSESQPRRSGNGARRDNTRIVYCVVNARTFKITRLEA